MSDSDQTFPHRTEQDVRECIIRPLLERLGYKPEMVLTQLTLRYQYLFLGRKKGCAKDRPLVGEADYIIEVDGRLRLVIEAKKPGPLTEEEREQAYSYAMHPEVRAIMFAVISGTHFEIFSTFHKPESGPILQFTYAELEQKFPVLLNLIGPDALCRSYPQFKLDVGQPLGPGLRSFAKIESGFIRYISAPSYMDDLIGLVVHFSEGSIVRVDSEDILVLMKPSFHHRNISQFAKAIDAEWVELVSSQHQISTDPLRPSIFYGQRVISVQKGTPVPGPSNFANPPVSASTVTSTAKVKVSGYLVGTRFVGALKVSASVHDTQFQVIMEAELELVLQ
jgi:hypothetical protein